MVLFATQYIWMWILNDLMRYIIKKNSREMRCAVVPYVELKNTNSGMHADDDEWSRITFAGGAVAILNRKESVAIRII